VSERYEEVLVEEEKETAEVERRKDNNLSFENVRSRGIGIKPQVTRDREYMARAVAACIRTSGMSTSRDR
jgi:hypothetical protein